MTWNPLKRSHLTCKPSFAPPAISRTNDAELEQLFHRLQNLEDATKKLQKEMKKYLESVMAAGRLEQKVTSELSSSQMCHNNAQLRQLTEDYHTVTSEIFVGAQDLSRKLQQCFHEPLKIFKGQFGNIDAAFHRREQIVQEWRSASSRVKKLEEKDRTAGTIMKLEKERKTLEITSQELANFHSVLLTDLSQFLSKRSDYFSPTLQALIRSQLDYHGNTTRLFTHLLPQSSQAKGTPTSAMIPEDQYLESVQSKLSKIRALSMVKRQ